MRPQSLKQTAARVPMSLGLFVIRQFLLLRVSCSWFFPLVWAPGADYSYWPQHCY